jgi:hypothetical protein
MTSVTAGRARQKLARRMHRHSIACKSFFFDRNIACKSLTRRETPKRNRLSLPRPSPLQTGKAPPGLLLPWRSVATRHARTVSYLFQCVPSRGILLHYPSLPPPCVYPMDYCYHMCTDRDYCCYQCNQAHNAPGPAREYTRRDRDVLMTHVSFAISVITVLLVR